MIMSCNFPFSAQARRRCIIKPVLVGFSTKSGIHAGFVPSQAFFAGTKGQVCPATPMEGGVCPAYFPKDFAGHVPAL